VIRPFFLCACLFLTHARAAEELDLLAKAKDQGIELTEEERLMIKSRAPTKETYIIGGIIGTYPGFGLGHAIQGRWRDRGWIYTLGETAGVLVAGAGLINCFGDTAENDDCDRSAIKVGMGTYIGFKLVEIYDVWVGGARHRERYDRLRGRIEKTSSWSPLLKSQGGGLAFAWRW
jgi:hypothetical protein